MTGGGSRASTAYPVYTLPSGVVPGLDSIVSPAGGSIRLVFDSTHPLVNGNIVTVSSTAETVAAGAAGTWRVVFFDPDEAQAVSLAAKLIPLLDDPVQDVRVRACQTLLVFDRSARTEATVKR